MQILYFGGPAASLQYTVSLVQWLIRLLSAQWGSVLHPRDAPTLTMAPGSFVSNVCYSGDLDMIDHWPCC